MNEQQQESSKASRCPVDHSKLGEKSGNGDDSSSSPSSLWKIFGSSGSDSGSSSSSSVPQGGQGNARLSELRQMQQQQSDSVGGGCPVDHGKITNPNIGHVSKPSLLESWFGWKSNESSSKKGDDAVVVASLEEAAKYAQTPQPGQIMPLSTHRATSSIPRGFQNPTKSPHHQPKSTTSTTTPNSCSSTESVDNTGQQQQQQPPNWVYPSEQQVFNAMKRKGWEGIEETSIPSFLQIHNSVNERSWRQLCDWEQEQQPHGSQSNEITLVRFQGRPNTLSPKAFVLSSLGLAPKPFDRHDWYIDNGTDHEKRYILDFYMYDDGGPSSSSSSRGGLPRVEIDVRPALDSPQAVLARIQRVASDAFPGISTAIKQWSSSSRPPPSSF